MDENIIVRFELRQPKVKEVLEKAITSMEDFKLQEEGDSLSCDLLILEIGEDLEKEFQLIQKIQDSGVLSHLSPPGTPSPHPGPEGRGQGVFPSAD
jgi:hypothetical protein